MGRSNLKIILDTGAANNFAPVSIGTYYKDAKIFQLKNIIRVKTADGTIHEITQGCKIMLPPPFRTTYLANEFVFTPSNSASRTCTSLWRSCNNEDCDNCPSFHSNSLAK